MFNSILIFSKTLLEAVAVKDMIGTFVFNIEIIVLANAK